MVINYQKLNAKTKKYNYPIPNKILLLREIQGYKWFSKFDCKSGFHHLKLTEESKPLTAFTVPNGFYEWNVLPFGYQNAPGRYQAFMDKIYNQLENCKVYIDDILIYTKTKEEHLKILEKFVNLTKENGIAISQKKTELFKNEIGFLGHNIDYNGIEMQEHVVKKIIGFNKQIDTRKELQSFLGTVNQVRDNVPTLAQYLIPLQGKLKKDVQWKWTKEDEENLQKVKEVCKKLPKLSYPDDKKNFKWILETDASENAYGGVLKYKYKNEPNEYVCKYHSGSFKGHECQWDINRKELAAVRYGLLNFELYIVFQKFILRIDNSTVKAWLSKNLSNSVVRKKINQMIAEIKVFQFDIELIKSEQNVLADRLSRTKVSSNDEKDRELGARKQAIKRATG